MGITLKVPVDNAVEALDLKAQVNQICEPGEFSWRYDPPVNNWLGDMVLTPGAVIFEFGDEQLATYFQLKWAK